MAKLPEQEAEVKTCLTDHRNNGISAFMNWQILKQEDRCVHNVLLICWDYLVVLKIHEDAWPVEHEAIVKSYT